MPGKRVSMRKTRDIGTSDFVADFIFDASIRLLLRGKRSSLLSRRLDGYTRSRHFKEVSQLRGCAE